MKNRIRTRMLTLFAAIAASILTATYTIADRRVALVIGNADYSSEIPLRNPVNDADDLADAFEEIGFDVDLHHNLTFAGTRRALRLFSRKASGADIAIIYFAGHGMEVDGLNYLIPTDAELASDLDLPFEAFEIAQFAKAVSGAMGLQLLILDACRDNPFAQTMELTSKDRSVGRGFSRIEPAASSMLIAYSAAAGTTADDGAGRNSPYAHALLKHIGEPGLDIRFMFGKIREDVLKSTGKQRPAEYGSLPGRPIFLKPAEPGYDHPSVTQKQEGDARREEPISVNAAWVQVKDTDDVELIEAFRKQYGIRYAFLDILAERRIAAIRDAGVAARDLCDRLAASPSDSSARAEGQKFSDLEQHPNEAVEACTLAAKTFPDDLTTRFQLGRAHQASKEYDAALENYRNAGDRGHADSQINLGTMYKDAIGVERDYSEALGRYRKAAEQGHSLGQYYVGSMYSNGRGVEKDQAEAVRWYRKAAQQGNDWGQAALGYAYQHGLGVEQRYALALKWYRKAAEHENEFSQNSLGIMYLNGFGVEVDATEAIKWFRLAAEQGYPDSQTVLGYAYQKGIGVEQDYDMAMNWYRAAAEQGEARAKSQLEEMHKQGLGAPKETKHRIAIEQTDASVAANKPSESRRTIRSSEIPSSLLLANPPEPMICQVGDPFSPSRHIDGIRSLATSVRGTLHIICPTRRETWKEFTIPIGWFDDSGSGYTDCSRHTGRDHTCWITIPQDQL